MLRTLLKNRFKFEEKAKAAQKPDIAYATGS
jgi:hypothetical protein